MIKKSRQAILDHGLVPLVGLLVRLYLKTIRLTVHGEEKLTSHLDLGGKAIAAVWHQRLFGLLGYAKRLSRFQPAAIISQSGDGDLLAAFLGRLDIRPIRGSSSRGGAQALRRILRDLKQNSLVGHALDGPRGPAWKIKPGLVVMAQLSGARIFPLYISMDRAWQMKSWDRFFLPKPFSRLLIHWGDPLAVPPGQVSGDQQQYLEEIEETLKKGQWDLDESWRLGKGGSDAFPR
jgi:lysophospholipid acyltransferase (LPLAT)-like uncharacterized protein